MTILCWELRGNSNDYFVNSYNPLMLLAVKNETSRLYSTSKSLWDFRVWVLLRLQVNTWLSYFLISCLIRHAEYLCYSDAVWTLLYSFSRWDNFQLLVNYFSYKTLQPPKNEEHVAPSSSRLLEDWIEIYLVALIWIPWTFFCLQSCSLLRSSRSCSPFGNLQVVCSVNNEICLNWLTIGLILCHVRLCRP